MFRSVTWRIRLGFMLVYSVHTEFSLLRCANTLTVHRATSRRSVVRGDSGRLCAAKLIYLDTWMPMYVLSQAFDPLARPLLCAGSADLVTSTLSYLHTPAAPRQHSRRNRLENKIEPFKPVYCACTALPGRIQPAMFCRPGAVGR
jgi:hypothetical protein